MIATSFDVSAACFHSCPPILRKNITRFSFIKSNSNINMEHRTVVVQPKFSNFRTMCSLKGNLEDTIVGVPTSVPVRVAHELFLAGHKYLDVR
ncbi:senescence-associated protein DIN1 [Trifolium pratense]|nr:senescence-associated protein DIN1 [Trifolium pratense]